MDIKQQDFTNLPESDSIINYIVDRFNKGLNCNILATGGSGKGKSSICQRMGELVCLKIHKENRMKITDIQDSLLGFIRRLRQVKAPGEIIILEEISVLFPTRRAMGADNVNIGKILDTCRKKQVLLFMNAPVYKTIDSHVRSMCHILLQAKNVNRSKEVCLFKAWKLQVDYHSGKEYRHNFSRNGREVRMHFTKKPNKELWESYEEVKDDFMDGLYKELEASTLLKQREKNKKLGLVEKREIIKPFTPNEMKIYDLVERKGYTQTEAAKRMGITPQTVHTAYHALLRKLKFENAKNLIKSETPLGVLPS